VEAIAEVAPLKRTTPVKRQDLKDWVKAHYGVELDDRWLDVLLQEHVLALRRHIERKKARTNATTKELIDLMVDEIDGAMQRHQIESN
jgi:hypothetical protein